MSVFGHHGRLRFTVAGIIVCNYVQIRSLYLSTSTAFRDLVLAILYAESKVVIELLGVKSRLTLCSLNDVFSSPFFVFTKVSLLL